MAHRFSLAPVLRVREIVAEREERALGRILAEMAQLRRGIERIELEITRTARVREQGLTANMRAVHLQTSYVCVRDLRETRRQFEEQLSKLEAAREVQTRACETAYRNREVLAGMRDEQHAAWLAERAKTEQKQADDAFLRRFDNRK